MTHPMRKALKVFFVTTLVGVAALAFLGWKAYRYPDETSGFALGPVELDIPKGAGAQQVSELLADKGLLQRPAIFRLYAGQRGVASRFKAGHYRIEAPTTPRQLPPATRRALTREALQGCRRGRDPRRRRR